MLQGRPGYSVTSPQAPSTMLAIHRAQSQDIVKISRPSIYYIWVTSKPAPSMLLQIQQAEAFTTSLDFKSGP